MRSPFPGMDPFIESQKWEDFHTRYITAVGDALVAALRPRYTVEVERRIYLEESDPFAPVQNLIADAAIFNRNQSIPGDLGGVAVLADTVVVPKVCTIPFVEEHRETFVTIRRGSPSEVVTVIEMLSPTNKRIGTDGREQYIDKFSKLMKTRTSVVELDLLRGGQRTMVSTPPEGDYFAIVSRPKPRPLADVYAWPLAHRLPIIPIPLAHGDPDAPLDLQAVFDLVYDRAGYDYSLNYQQPIAPTVAEAEATWIDEQLASIQNKTEA